MGIARAYGRLEQGSYACYSLPADDLAPRWRTAAMGILVVVGRNRKKLNGSQESQEVCYYVSKARPADQVEAEELFDAVRGHWLVAVMHHHRDMALAEDKLKTEIQPVSRMMSTLRTLAVNLLKRLKPKNMAAQIDEFADRFQLLIQKMVL